MIFKKIKKKKHWKDFLGFNANPNDFKHFLKNFLIVANSITFNKY